MPCHYEAIWSAWQSGQITAVQMAEHLKDEVFRRWLKKRDLLSPFLLDLIPKDDPDAPDA
jgi:hypothetical protein